MRRIIRETSFYLLSDEEPSFVKLLGASDRGSTPDCVIAFSIWNDGSPVDFEVDYKLLESLMARSPGEDDGEGSSKAYMDTEHLGGRR